MENYSLFIMKFFLNYAPINKTLNLKVVHFFSHVIVQLNLGEL